MSDNPVYDAIKETEDNVGEALKTPSGIVALIIVFTVSIIILGILKSL